MTEGAHKKSRRSPFNKQPEQQGVKQAVSWDQMSIAEKVEEINKGRSWPEGTTLDDINILIATPHSYPTIHKQWFVMYQQLIKPATSRLYMDPSLPLSDNRNNAVLEAQEAGADYIMFIDHDNILNPHQIVQLIQYNVPICGALYFERKYPNLPVMYTFEEDYETVRVYYDYQKGTIPVDVTGLGCTLIDMRVFDIIPKPWFCYQYKDSTWGTEDIGFFHKVHDFGINTLMDTKNTVGHLTEAVVDEGDWLANKDGYLAEVDRKAKEFGSQSVYVDKRKNEILASSKDANTSTTGGK